MMNVVIYARFSSHSQTEQSTESQLKVGGHEGIRTPDLSHVKRTL